MLILGRKQGQRIVIGEEITIEVVSIDHGTVRLGVVAPPDRSGMLTAEAP